MLPALLRSSAHLAAPAERIRISPARPAITPAVPALQRSEVCRYSPLNDWPAAGRIIPLRGETPDESSYQLAGRQGRKVGPRPGERGGMAVAGRSRGLLP